MDEDGSDQSVGSFIYDFESLFSDFSVQTIELGG